MGMQVRCKQQKQLSLTQLPNQIPLEHIQTETRWLAVLSADLRAFITNMQQLWQPMWLSSTIHINLRMMVVFLYYSRCQKGSQSVQFFSALGVLRGLNVAKRKQTNPKLQKYLLFLYESIMHLQHYCTDISPCISLCKSLWNTRVGAGLMKGGISHDYGRDSNVAAFLSLTETVEYRDRVPNIYSWNTSSFTI